MTAPKIGHVLPVGGPVPPDYVIGRSGEIDQLVTRLSESIHTMASGERKIGKTTVCDAACARVKPELEIVRIEVPERKDADARVLLQSVIDRCNTVSRRVDHEEGAAGGTSDDRGRARVGRNPTEPR